MYLRAHQPFCLEPRWLQAQAFRWSDPDRDGWSYGFVGGALIRARQHDVGVEFESDVPEESLTLSVERYFRVNQDIAQVHEALRQADDTGKMDDLIQKYGGMRVLRQDSWECLVAYICSQNKSVSGIKKIADDIAEKYGTRLTIGDMQLYAFPPAQRLAAVNPKDLQKLAPGLSRGERIHEVAKDIIDGRLELAALARMPHQHARAVLMSYEDIGAKIADCVCLFSLDRPEAFPIDRRIADGLKKHYNKSYIAGRANAGLMQWAHEKFGPNAGYAGQLLFLDSLDKSNGNRPA